MLGLVLIFVLKLLAFASDVDAVQCPAAHPLRRDRLLGLLWTHAHFVLALGIALLASALALLCRAAGAAAPRSAARARNAAAGRLLLCTGFGVAMLGLTLVKAASAPGGPIDASDAAAPSALADFERWARRRAVCLRRALAAAYVVQTALQLGASVACAFLACTPLGARLTNVELLGATTAGACLILLASYLDECATALLAPPPLRRGTPVRAPAERGGSVGDAARERLLSRIESAVAEAAERADASNVALLARARALVAFERSGAAEPRRSAAAQPVAGASVPERVASGAARAGAWLAMLNPLRRGGGGAAPPHGAALYGAVGDGGASADESAAGDADRRGAARSAAEARAVSEGREHALRRVERQKAALVRRVRGLYMKKGKATPIGVGAMDVAQLQRLEKKLSA